MTSYRSGQGDAFHIATDPLQIGRGVAVVHPQYVLLDNRPGVQFLGYVVRRGSNELDSTLPGPGLSRPEVDDEG